MRFALRTISAKMSAGGTEPVLVIVDAKDGEEFHDRWAQLQAHWSEAQAQGKIKNLATPFALAVSPRLQDENAAKLAHVDFAAARDALTKAVETEGFNPDPFKKSFVFLDHLAAVSKGDRNLLNWHETLPDKSNWWFILDRFLGTEQNVSVAYIWPNQTISSVEAKEELRKTLEVPGVPIHISGWSYTLANLVPWSRGTARWFYLDGKLAQLSIAMVLFNIVLLIFLYRRFFPLFILMLSLFLSIGGMIASLKLFHIPLNLFNVLAFPLVLGVGVDYGIYMLLAVRQPGDREHAFATILKPVLLSGLTAVAGFGSLAFAKNPSLVWLGLVCALGVAWCLFSTVFFILPVYVWKAEK